MEMLTGIKALWFTLCNTSGSIKKQEAAGSSASYLCTSLETELTTEESFCGCMS